MIYGYVVVNNLFTTIIETSFCYRFPLGRTDIDLREFAYCLLIVRSLLILYAHFDSTAGGSRKVLLIGFVVCTFCFKGWFIG